ncbi:CYTH domain-containing protein [Bacillaceae bacterium Marseille-Q3522]|nr:CYTH domain-containing protein [Bacillaceae bacterium Marseille-Q3522]
MKQNIEIEFKNIITKKEYELLLSYFQLTEENFYKQDNHYFDTVNFSLKKQKSALRIRKKLSGYEMTLKQPHKEGLLESTISLTEEQASLLLQEKPIFTKESIALLSLTNIDHDTIRYLGKLTTKRAEVLYKNGIFVLDHNYYLNQEDYEVEYEVSNRKAGFQHFSALLKQFKIPMRETKNKILRFYQAKYHSVKEDNK